jgi:hypothetical protein
MGVSIIVIRENSSCYLFCGEVLVTERMPATSLFHFFSSPSSDGVLGFSFRLGMFSKKFWVYRFISLAITFVISGVQYNSEYSRGLLGSCKSTFMPGLPVNVKCGHLAPDFAHKPCCKLLLSLTFSSSSELTVFTT